jgi:hypothetical protein
VATKEQSLFAGNREIINRALGIADHGTRRDLNAAMSARHDIAIYTALVKDLYAQISSNWSAARAARNKPPSAENWRWKVVANIAAKNNSPEVVLERAIAQAIHDAQRDDWGNQVPVASGIVDQASHRRSAIDLVHQSGDRAFEFIELKIGSNTPLSAAIEILQYGLCWLISREQRAALGYEGRKLIEADVIHLVVLAPASYYHDYDMHLGDSLDQALRQFSEPRGVSMSFAFQAFSDDLLRPRYAAEEALAILSERSSV